MARSNVAPSVMASGQQGQQQQEVSYGTGYCQQDSTSRPLQHLQTYAKDGGTCVEIDIKEGATVGELITQLGVSAHTTWNAAMDGKLVYNNDLLFEGAVLMLFPPLAGG
jgi:molybdopterin converting factor small subunit